MGKRVKVFCKLSDVNWELWNPCKSHVKNMVACVCNYSTPEHQEGRGGQKITLEVHEPGVSSKRQTKDPA